MSISVLVHEPISLVVILEYEMSYRHLYHSICIFTVLHSLYNAPFVQGRLIDLLIDWITFGDEVSLAFYRI